MWHFVEVSSHRNFTFWSVTADLGVSFLVEPFGGEGQRAEC